MAWFDATVVVVALSSLGIQFGFESLGSVLAMYMLSSACSIPLYGYLADVIGRRWVHLTSLLIFIAGSALCGAAQSVQYHHPSPPAASSHLISSPNTIHDTKMRIIMQQDKSLS